MRRFISSFFGCSSSGAVGIEVTTESTKIKRIKNNMAVRKKMKDKELAAQLVNMQVQYDILKSETAVTTKRTFDDLDLEQYTASMTAKQESEEKLIAQEAIFKRKLTNQALASENEIKELTEEYEKKFESAIIDFEIRLKEQKLSVL
eukprot:CAMPEP_0119039020 /NCGR_PEP_ID=MMETSP1177-20130426/8293_1 /TAXON_ID=2985 /ORGANISM="Ochromonas sp, Strain CCMP1899" /LENGTH=146 /DNA_ID=CAMNT_0007002375 /DNA_START=144 /DNA_END=581 /DNA_ORIENTATION=+